jgi:hypothetical protein
VGFELEIRISLSPNEKMFYASLVERTGPPFDAMHFIALTVRSSEPQLPLSSNSSARYDPSWPVIPVMRAFFITNIAQISR